MIKLEPVELHNKLYTAIVVELPETSLTIVTGKKGYIMCGALDIDILNKKWPNRKMPAARALGVQTIDELLEAPLADVSKAAEALGVKKGMTGKEALYYM
ncbi:Uncharacterized protein YunC, DUF1805 family [Alteribacillus persepolensis]|uniref:Uncharacterized protein YunC, DUF1805 family n=1 Tax=Alteribacillus persepolensis TaxID=568899 RepID=A0A1G8DW70_9BACI|nr:DUF1805 domain-containing protein [Alteribacillus persepolensis]SDH61907.1 Uncharacterized protein YunC, DUF1805 family [Alteribacillus persepolensis]